MQTRIWAWLLLLVGLCPRPAVAGQSQVEVRWTELSPLILGKKVMLVLPGAVSVTGEAVAVRDDNLKIKIQKTSDNKAFPKGIAEIPRASVTTLQLGETKHVGGRAVGLVVGMLGGMVAGGEIAAHSDMREGAAVGTFLGVAVGGTVAGYYAGKSLDSHTTVIRIVP